MGFFPARKNDGKNAPNFKKSSDLHKEIEGYLTWGGI